MKVIANVASTFANRLAATRDIIADIASHPKSRKSEELDDLRKKLFSEWSS